MGASPLLRLASLSRGGAQPNIASWGGALNNQPLSLARHQ
jgi:hypothetical protein